MNTVNINIEQLKEYIESSFDEDFDTVKIYDKKENVKSIEDVCNNIFLKIKIEFPLSEIRGIDIEGKKVGYFVYYKNTLISFALNKGYRNKNNLTTFFEFIKNSFKGTFQCLLFSYNLKAIKWLKKCGMNVIFEEVTVLQFDNN